MKVEIKVPEMGESITEATIAQIMAASGTQVAVDDEILELETDKVNQVLYATAPGTLTIDVNVDDTVTVGQVIGAIETSEEMIKEKPPPPVKEEALAMGKEKKEEGIRRGKEAFVKDLMREEEEKPVEAPAAPKAAPQSAPGERRETRHKMTKIRKVIAQRLVEAQQTTAMLTTFNEVDLSAVMALRDKYRDRFIQDYGVRLGFMSFFVKAAVAALREFPGFNSYIDGEDIVHREYYDIGIAVGTERGLIVPVVRDCDLLTFAEIETAIADFAERARKGGLSVDELQGGGFTITNGGVYGSLLSTPILNPPQCGILGMHKIEKRPVVVDDQVVVRPMMYLALSYDHRIVDGQTAVSFLVSIKENLEDPTRMLLHI